MSNTLKTAAVAVGDRVVVESERVGQPPREGDVLAVIGSGDGAHYRVRWHDGHEGVLFPGAGSVTFVPKGKRAERKPERS